MYYTYRTTVVPSDDSKIVPKTYNVFGGTLNPTLLLLVITVARIEQLNFLH